MRVHRVSIWSLHLIGVLFCVFLLNAVKPVHINMICCSALWLTWRKRGNENSSLWQEQDTLHLGRVLALAKLESDSGTQNVERKQRCKSYGWLGQFARWNHGSSQEFVVRLACGLFVVMYMYIHVFSWFTMEAFYVKMKRCSIRNVLFTYF